MNELWTEQEVSDRYRIPVGTLRYWRTTKKVLPYRKLGALVRYVREEVEAVIEASKVQVAD